MKSLVILFKINYTIEKAKRVIMVILFTIMTLGCNKNQNEVPVPTVTDLNTLIQVIPEGFPPMTFPTDNEFTIERWELGKSLFYDPILSIDSSISCSSCHKIDLAFADDVAFSKGVFERDGVRNSPSLANIGYHPYFLREGAVPTLEMQVLVPIQEFNEFNHNIVDISEQLLNNQYYSSMSNKAYDREIDPYVITRSISVFERTLISGNSKYDQHTYQGKNVMSQDEIDGMNLFFSDKTKCSECHSDFNFTNYLFENTGLYEEYNDIGRMRFTNDSSDLAMFKTPSLRNVEITSPYMHDGSITSLEDVLEHYNKGGNPHINKSDKIINLNLTENEKAQIVAFLKTLTDNEFIKNNLLKP